MTAEVRPAVWRAGRRPPALAVNAAGMVAGKSAALALGFAFWVVAAHLARPNQLGLAAGAVAAVMLSTQLASFGVGSAFIREYGREPPAARAVLLDTTLALCTALSVLAGLLFVAVAGVWLARMRIVVDDPTFAATFVAMAVMGTLGIVLDQVSVATGNPGQIVTRNVASGVVPIVVLVTAGAGSGPLSARTLFVAWSAGGVALCALGYRQIYGPGRRPAPAVAAPLLRRLVVVGLPNHLLTVTERVPGLVLPLVVTETLSPAANATWYVAWMMAWALYIMPIAMAMALFAANASDRAGARATTRRAVRVTLPIGAGCAALVAVLAGPLLALAGHGYSQGATALRILTLAVLPLTITHAYYANRRAQHRLAVPVTLGCLNASASIVVAALAARSGSLATMALGWLAVQLAAAGCAAVGLALDRRQPATATADGRHGT